VVIGTFTTMFLWIFASSLPSAIISFASSETTSALIGPSTIERISSSTSRNLRPVLATSDGFVVTPSTMPISWALRISPTSAVSMKNFMRAPSARSGQEKRRGVVRQAMQRVNAGVCLLSTRSLRQC
jgi:hypothetical protein